MKFSLIVPVYNRPDEMIELLTSLRNQDFKDYELIVIEDGSEIKSDTICKEFEKDINIKYFFKTNEGPSIGRNFGAEKAQGDYLVFTDSDCILPVNYFSKISENISEDIQGYGGPDASHKDFNNVQKAISYSMTSMLTTGGIRGQNKEEKNYVLRSFNMTILRSAFLEMGGFPTTRLHPGEDTIFGIDFLNAGFRTKIIPEAFVYHKRRNTFKSFFKQIFNFGKVRYLISKLYPKTFKITFLFPSVFCLFLLFAILTLTWTRIPFYCLLAYFVGIFIEASLRNKSVIVGLIAIFTTLIQFTAYHLGFTRTVWDVEVLRKDEFNLNLHK